MHSAVAMSSQSVTKCARCKNLFVQESHPFKPWTCGHCPAQGICVILEESWADITRSDVQVINDTVGIIMMSKDKSFSEMTRPMFTSALARVICKLKPCDFLLEEKVVEYFKAHGDLIVIRYMQSLGGTAALLKVAKSVYFRCMQDVVDSGPDYLEILLATSEVKKVKKFINLWLNRKPDIRLNKSKWRSRIEAGMPRPDMDALSAKKIQPPPKECRAQIKRKLESFTVPDYRPVLARKKR